MVKWKVEPTPTVLLAPILPPMSSVSRRLIANPRPVPPCRRVVEPSSWWKGANSWASSSGGMPMPVSATAKRTS